MGKRTPEGKVKEKVKVVLHSLGAYYAMPVTGGYGSSGVPDFLVCFAGKFIAIECKANGGKPTALQMMNLDKIRDCYGYVFVIDKTNVGNLTQYLLELIK